ncbi:MAG: DUF4124 domain-containing protein [Gammaproteobacteria bacterium]|jgi:hypothetical protein
MKQEVAAIFILYLTLPGSICAKDSAYQWTDKQGQTHYGDKPPVNNESRAIALQRDMTGIDSQSGLRPGEHARLGKMEQRQRQQQQRTEVTRTRSKRELAARRSRCAENREMLKNSRGNENFKKYARYLRNNCW